MAEQKMIEWWFPLSFGPTNPPGLRRWKRAQFHAWLDRLTPTDVEAIMNE